MTSDHPWNSGYTYSYDSMGRPSSLYQNGVNQFLVSGIGYTAAGQLTSMTHVQQG